MTSRREFVELSALSAMGLVFPTAEGRPAGATVVADDGGRSEPTEPVQPAARGFVNVLRAPDLVLVQTATDDIRLTRGPGSQWSGINGLAVTTTPQKGALNVALSAPRTAVKRLHLRWRGSLADTRLVLGDAWERGYGDLEWRGWAPDRVMPWYFATSDGARTDAYGVRTGAAALCFWQADQHGISLWADVRSGSAGLSLGERTLDVCDVLSRAGRGEESAFAAIRAFCRSMCRNPRLPAAPVYGSNDWYWAYGKNSADSIRLDTKNLVELCPAGGNRPFSVIDDGWQPGRGADKSGTGTWDRGNEKFGDMAALAADIRGLGARPGVWVRPLQAMASAPENWRLPRDKSVLDPTVPDVQQKVAADIARVREWGYELIKHDYTTFDLFGRWGFQMGAAMTRDGWTFAEGPRRTTAEVIDELYATIRTAAGSSLVIGCNTVSHLSAGHFEICRIGDDTSGTEWPRTRKMGVNTLAFRGVQHGAFYVADADCVGVTNAVPWSLNRQWLDLLARSGTMLFTSLAPDALGAEQRRDLKAAFALAASPQPLAEPLDWQQSVYPERWRMLGRERRFDWTGADGPGLP